MTWFFAGLILLRLLTAVFMFLVVARIIVAVIGGGREHHRQFGKQRAIMGLRRRYAEGDINDTVYRERLAVLRED